MWFLCTYMQCPLWLKGLNRYPRAGATSRCGRMDVGASNQIQVLWKNCTNS